jgi:hypothetical protein
MASKKTSPKVSTTKLKRLLSKMHQAESLVQDVSDSIRSLPKGTKNLGRRTIKLFEAYGMIATQKSNLIRDWERSAWFDEELHADFLRELEDQFKQLTISRQQKL